MKKQFQPLTPAALYARVSSDRQDVDLSVAAQLRALRDYAKNNGYSVAREYVDEAESGRIADRPRVPQDDRRGQQGQRPPFHVILVWKFSEIHTASGNTPWPSRPSCGARASAWCPSPSRPRTTPPADCLRASSSRVDEYYSRES